MSEVLTLRPQHRVRLRNRSHAILTHGIGGLPPFALMGHIEGDPAAVHLWRQGGHWLETNDKHALDIITLITAEGSEINFAKIEVGRVQP
jgi:hypothetical protein